MPNPFHVDESRPWFTSEAGWPDEVPKNMEFPEKTLGEFLKESVVKWPDQPAIWFLDTWVTYRELDDLVDRFATGLHRAGVQKGDVVAALLPNSIQYVVAYYACARLGAILSGVNPTYKPGEILHQLETVHAKVLIVLDALYEPSVAPIREQAPFRLVIASNIADLALSPLKRFLGRLLKKIPTGPVPPDALRFKDLCRTPPDVPKVEIDVRTHPATYIMTGGTTGVPKAAVLSHFNCVSNALQSAAWLYKAQPGACDVGVLPLFHSFAHTCVMNISIACGCWMMLFPKPPPTDELIRRIETLAPPEGALYPGAEILFQKLAEFPGIENRDLSRLTLCVSGAGPLHRPVQEAFERNTGGKLSEGYGLTEATPVVCAGPFWGNRKIGTIGLPFPGTEWRIADPTDPTRTLPPGPEHPGELLVAGPQVMVGYLDQPEATAETIVEMDGKRWLRTGDIGWMDEQGRVTISDRLKQLIKHKGFSVYPKEVEEYVGTHEGVLEVAVAGLPDVEAGERIKAWVVLRPEWKGKLTEEALLEWCRANMTKYKVPSWIEFRDELPKSLVGKVLRRTLQEADPLWKAAHPE
ncbi:MAG: AMP-binding protein [Deltaproteobacteria bacterium]|nr:AMP-binding protein [Deltaproteobacteria bacterium]